MAAKRGKSQARRNNGGNGNGIPGWAWAILGALLAMVVILVAPKYLKQDGDGFFRPQPNPDAQPAPVDEEDVVAAPATEDAPSRRAGGGDGEPEGDKASDYDFYTVLPGREVPLSDAELAASEQAEARREAERAARENAAAEASASNGPSEAASGTPAIGDLPQPIDEAPRASTDTRPSAADAVAERATPAKADDGTRYLLQAGAFAASGQAEEMKARIALLGVGARVEAAQISGRTVYRVRMGPYGTATDLADAKRKLAAGGLSALAIKVK